MRLTETKFYIYICLLVILAMSFSARGQQVGFKFNTRNFDQFNTTIGGNIAHSGERMGILNSEIFQPLKDLGVISLRTHDSKSLDWDMIFPNWDADPSNPNNYNFEKSDRIITTMIQNGFIPLLRLGVSVSAIRTKRTVGLNPPDPKKWSTVVANIVAHYTEGWGDGFNYHIQYLEIWNEPDISFWTGSNEAFYKLSYEALVLLKSRFPAIEIGLCGISNIQKNERFADNLLGFLADPNGDGRSDDRVKIDFFSWHVYELKRGLLFFTRFAEISRKLLDKHGYSSVKNFCTEWNADLPSPYLKSFDATIDITSTMIWSENNGVDAIYFYPLIDNWGLFNLKQDKSSNLPSSIVGSNLSYGFKAFQDLKKNTSNKLLLLNTNKRKDLQVIGAMSTDNSLLQFLISSKSSAKENMNITIQNLNFNTAKVTIYQQTSTGLRLVNRRNLKFSDSQLSLNFLINAKSIFLVKVEEG